MYLRIGKDIGCQASIFDKLDPNAKIIFKLDSILLTKDMIQDKSLSEYKCIIIDEAHERNVNSDVLIGFLKEAIKLNPDLRVIITSATLDEDLFKNFFDVQNSIKVSGRLHPATIRYKPYNEMDKDHLD